MSNNAKRLIKQQQSRDQRLVTHGQLNRLCQILDQHFAAIRAEFAAQQNRPWWRRFLGLR